MIMYISLIGGLVILILAGDLLVRGSISIAERVGIPKIVIGLTIVSFGTSAPELMVSLKSAFHGNDGIAVGNVVGSNITNVLLVLGIPSFIRATSCSDRGTGGSAIFMVFVTVIFVYFLLQGRLEHFHGFILLSLLGCFLAWTVYETRIQKKAGLCSGCDADEMVEGVPKHLGVALVFTIIGMIGLPLGGFLTVLGGEQIARAWHVSEAAIGITVIALGTSLPELATTLVAAMRNHSAIALGNVIGSNIFNILAIMGLTTAIIPLNVHPQIMSFDVWVMLGTALLIIPTALFCFKIGKKTGLAFVISYFAFVGLVLAPGT